MAKQSDMDKALAKIDADIAELHKTKDYLISCRTQKNDAAPRTRKPRKAKQTPTNAA